MPIFPDNTRKMLRLITLNTWGGKLRVPMLEFLKKQSSVTDVFCFQEVFFGTEPRFGVGGIRENIFSELKLLLQNFEPYFHLSPKGTNYMRTEIDFDVGVVTFVKRDIKVKNSSGFYTYHPTSETAKNRNITMTGNCLQVELENNVQIFNIHGLWQKEGKTDTSARFTQNSIVQKYIGNAERTVFCGDFNLDISTDCIKSLETKFLNHVRINNIKSTRSTHYTKMGLYADYILTSKDLNCVDFKVYEDIISDHLALGIEIILV